MRTICLISLLLLSFCQPDETISAYAGTGSQWRLVSIDDQPFEASADLLFPEEGEVTGAGPCNTFTARQTAPYPWIEVRDIAAARRACPDLPAETIFFEALEAMALAEVSGDILILTDESGRQLIFERQ
ncbi:META domain-containing protein [Actibacterium sp. 188UL27-1]|uniref:META domain-containing protein n=1 Tax=Actibacterium sp. 188UL27-1 TaxID=2786961 RepID=UPI00195AE09E|nr:META domain-containing protein [Actibacterium sp. 188UL27-1]MBM7070117.1 META domain-containing protein [Actibacterium sp. 188UL27-1]